MSRKFDPETLVQLPALDALAAQTLGSAVLAAAANKTLPPPVAKALAEVKAAVEALLSTSVQRMPTSDTLVVRTADINLDAAWSVLYGLIHSWSRLPDHPHAEAAATLKTQLFPNRLRFTRLPYRQEWAESKIRLQTVDERGFAPQIEQLGGSAVLAQIRQAHAHYGDVLAVNIPQEPEPSISVRDARSAVMKALRLFVVRVTASVSEEDPASADLARDLLAPIETWEHTAATKPAAAQPPAPSPSPPAPAPAVTPAPATADHQAAAGGAVAAPPASAH